MIKQFRMEVNYWDEKTRVVEIHYPHIKDSEGRKIKDLEHPFKVIVNLWKEVQNVEVKPNNDVIVTLVNNEKFLLENGGLFIGNRKISPLKSAFCNKWNVMLPLITYTEDEE